MSLWDRRADETEPAWRAFHTYLLMPERPRSIQAAYRASRPRQDSIGKRASGQWSKWSVDHEWVSRAAAYDAHLAKQDELLWEQRRRQLKEADWADGDALRQLVRDALPHARQFIHQQRRVIPAREGQPEQVIITLSFDVVGLSKVLTDASKTQRLATDEPTGNIQLTGAALHAYIGAQLRRIADEGGAGVGDGADADGSEPYDPAETDA